VNEEVAINGGYLARDSKVDIFDAIIAATAINNRMTLITRDKDFNRIKELKKLKIV